MKFKTSDAGDHLTPLQLECFSELVAPHWPDAEWSIRPENLDLVLRNETSPSDSYWWDDEDYDGYGVIGWQPWDDTEEES